MDHHTKDPEKSFSPLYEDKFLGFAFCRVIRQQALVATLFAKYKRPLLRFHLAFQQFTSEKLFDSLNGSLC